jgi:hypothetical protein
MIEWIYSVENWFSFDQKLNYNPVEERMIIQFMHVITLFSTLE